MAFNIQIRKIEEFFSEAGIENERAISSLTPE